MYQAVLRELMAIRTMLCSPFTAVPSSSLPKFAARSFS